MHQGVDKAVVADLAAALARTSVELTIGQKRDLAFEDEHDVDQEAYLEMVAGKTAALLRCATYGGAVLATDGSRRGAEEALAAMGEFGMRLGLAFQVRDDILGIWGAEDETGKPSGSDIRRRKKSLPIIFAFHAVPETAFDRLSALYSQDDELTPADEGYVRGVLDAFAFAQSQAKEQLEHALSALGRVAGHPETVRSNRFLAQLAELADFVTYRRF